MTQHLLDVAKISAAFQHQRGERVAEQVTGPLFVHSGGEDVVPGQLGEPVEGQLVAVSGEEQHAVVGFSGDGVADFVVVAIDPRERPLADRDQAVFASICRGRNYVAWLRERSCFGG